MLSPTKHMSSQNHFIPSYAAFASATTSVILGVNLTKNGIFTAALTHLAMFLTNSGS